MLRRAFYLSRLIREVATMARAMRAWWLLIVVAVILVASALAAAVQLTVPYTMYTLF